MANLRPLRTKARLGKAGTGAEERSPALTTVRLVRAAAHVTATRPSRGYLLIHPISVNSWGRVRGGIPLISADVQGTVKVIHGFPLILKQQ